MPLIQVDIMKILNFAEKVIKDRLDEKERAFIKHNTKVWGSLPAEKG